MVMTPSTIRRWYLVHKWTSLICTLFLLMLCITGLPLIFHAEIDTAMGGPVPAATVPPGSKPDLDKIAAQARRDHPGEKVLYLAWDPDKPVITAYTGPSFMAAPEQMQTQAFDARTGAPLAENPSYQKFTTFLLTLHDAMFMGLPGTLFLGAMGLLLVVALVSGVVVYIPVMRRLDFATIRKSRGKRLKWLDRHSLIGLVTLCWLAVVTVTGIINTLALPAETLWQRTELMQMLAPYRNLPPPAHRASLNRVVNTALRASPGMGLTSIAFPGTPLASERHYGVFLHGDTPVTRRLIAPRLVDAETGKLAAAREMPLYVKTLFLSQPLHFGDYGGLPLKILWALLDLAAIVVLGSGVYLWLGRRKTMMDRRLDALMRAQVQP